MHGKLDDLGDEVLQDPFLLRKGKPRMQCGQFYRDPGGREYILEVSVRAFADLGDTLMVRLEIAVGVLCRQRTLTEHIERIAVARVVFFQRPLQRFLDGSAHDELVSHDLHRLTHGGADDRLSCAVSELAENVYGIVFGCRVELQQPTRQHQAPCRGVDK